MNQEVFAYINPHLGLELLKFYENIFDSNSLIKAKLGLLSGTLLEDSVKNLQSLPGAKDVEFSEILAKLESGKKTLAKYEEESKKFLELVRNEELIEEIISKDCFTTKYLFEQYNISEDNIESVFQYALLLFEQGSYLDCNLLLYYYPAICPEQDKLINCYWGKITSQLLSQPMLDTTAKQCFQDLQMLKKLLSEKDVKHKKKGSKYTTIIKSRVWLLHTSLFLFFQKEVLSESHGMEQPKAKKNNMFQELLQLFLEENNLLALQLKTPWLITYIVAAFFLTRSSKYILRQIMRIIRQEQYHYSNVFTEFLFTLLDEVDFVKAMQCLKEWDSFIDQNPFLKPWKEELLKRGKTFFFETYCKVHKKLDIKWLGEELQISYEEAELWAVTLIRNIKIDAKIDSKNGQVVINDKPQILYQQTIDMTKDLAFRTYRTVSSGLS